VTLLDAYGLVALIADEPAADQVEEVLRRGDAGVVVANLAEALDVSQRTYRLSPAEIRAVLEPLGVSGLLKPVVSTEVHAWRAAELRARHYDRRTSAVSLPDCLLLAHALDDGGQIATADRALAAAARQEGGRVLGLPDSEGAKP
jgi:predicted nucleic acid-binding protein